jgi:hypothetical protein
VLAVQLTDAMAPLLLVLPYLVSLTRKLFYSHLKPVLTHFWQLITPLQSNFLKFLIKELAKVHFVPVGSFYT